VQARREKPFNVLMNAQALVKNLFCVPTNVQAMVEKSFSVPMNAGAMGQKAPWHGANESPRGRKFGIGLSFK
jgi:hypothetical protein